MQLDLGLPEPYHYHDSSSWGWFSTFAKTAGTGHGKQRSYPLHLLPDVIRNAPTDCDFYLSQAEFVKPNRRLVNLKQVGVCWVDLDLYKSGCPDYKPDQIEGLMLQHCADRGLPPPSLIVYSGRGVHCKWILNKPVPALALPRWNAVQRELATHFEQFGIDKGASDGSRVLRLVRTVNTATGEICRVLWEHQQDGSLVRYGFEDLARDLLPLERHKIKEKPSKGKALALVGGIQRNQSFTTKTLHWNRLADIRKIVQLRGWSEPIRGFQDTCLFLAACSLSWSVDPPRLWQEVEQLALEFVPSWSIREARAVLSTLMTRARQAAEGQKIEWRGQKMDPRYRFKTETIIDLLGITQSEQQHLLTLINKDELRRRNKISHEKARRAAGMVERETYLKTVDDRRKKAIELARNGLSQTAIAEALGINRRTVYRWLQRKS